MDNSDRDAPVQNLNNVEARSASGAIELAAIGLGGFGLLTLVNAAVGIGSALGVTTADFLVDYSLATMGFTGGLVLAAPAIVLGTLDLVAALGVHRLREWAYWAGVALLALHAILGVFANPLFTILGLFLVTMLGIQKRTFTRSFVP